MKIVSYNPKNVSNIPKFFNKNIEESSDESFLMFIFNDIYKNVKDKNNLVKLYEDLMLNCNLPYAFYPYYIHFNKILPESISKPNPRAHIFIKDKFAIDVISQPAYGMLILNLNELRKINFKFSEQYATSFYIQDLIHECYVNKLWFSETYFIDVYNSNLLFTDNFKDGYVIPSDVFLKEKTNFINNVKTESETINDFINKIKISFEDCLDTKELNKE